MQKKLDWYSVFNEPPLPWERIVCLSRRWHRWRRPIFRTWPISSWIRGQLPAKYTRRKRNSCREAWRRSLRWWSSRWLPRRRTDCAPYSTLPLRTGTRLWIQSSGPTFSFSDFKSETARDPFDKSWLVSRRSRYWLDFQRMYIWRVTTRDQCVRLRPHPNRKQRPFKNSFIPMTQIFWHFFVEKKIILIVTTTKESRSIPTTMKRITVQSKLGNRYGHRWRMNKNSLLFLKFPSSSTYCRARRKCVRQSCMPVFIYHCFIHSLRFLSSTERVVWEFSVDFVEAKRLFSGASGTDGQREMQWKHVLLARQLERADTQTVGVERTRIKQAPFWSGVRRPDRTTISRPLVATQLS